MDKYILDVLKKANISTGDIGYVLGTVEGEVIDSHNENKKFYGASTPKPIMALANLMLCSLPGTERCLTDDELSALLNYSTADDAKNIGTKVIQIKSTEPCQLKNGRKA